MRTVQVRQKHTQEDPLLWSCVRQDKRFCTWERKTENSHRYKRKAWEMFFTAACGWQRGRRELGIEGATAKRWIHHTCRSLSNSRGLLVCEVLIAFRAVYSSPITLQHTFTLHKLNIRNKHRHSHDFKTSSWKIFSAFTVDVINAALSLRLTLKHTKPRCLSWD